jgi:hypothetical protein
MHHTFEITIGKNDERSAIEFDILQTDIAQRWANEIVKNYPLYETDRFTNWPKSIKSKKYYEYYLKHHMDVIGKYGYKIDVSKLDFQDALNVMHKHFEDLRGHVDRPTYWYQTAPEEVKNSVDKFNVLIHEYENFLQEENQDFKNPTIVCTFCNRPTYKLDEGDYQHFTHSWEYGTVYINYCEVGKPLLDVFKDKDDYAEAVRPQSTYSADFMIKFGPTVPKEFVEEKQNDFDRWYSKQNYNFKHLSLGLVPVAKIKTDIDIDNLQGYNKVYNVKCKK